MFTDPQSVTVNSVANSIPRVAVGNRTATYTNGDNSITLTISHLESSKGRVRRMVRLDFAKTAPDPFISNQSRKVSMSTYAVIDEPVDEAFSNTEVLNNVKALTGWMTDANVTKVINGES